MLGQLGDYSTACMFTEAETLLLYEEQKKKPLTVRLYELANERLAHDCLTGNLFHL